MSPVLAGRFFTTEPPGKPSQFFLKRKCFNCKTNLREGEDTSKGQESDLRAKVLSLVLPASHGHLQATYPDRARMS